MSGGGACDHPAHAPSKQLVAKSCSWNFNVCHKVRAGHILVLIYILSDTNIMWRIFNGLGLLKLWEDIQMRAFLIHFYTCGKLIWKFYNNMLVLCLLLLCAIYLPLFSLISFSLMNCLLNTHIYLWFDLHLTASARWATSAKHHTCNPASIGDYICVDST